MSLLCVNVRCARLSGAEAYNTYVTLKLQNVKSTTVTVKGNNPVWEQDFLFETNTLDTGMVVELWNKGLFWDKLIGCHWMPLNIISISTDAGQGTWLPLDAEFIVEKGEICGTHTATDHSILIEAHFEPPFEYTIEDVSEFSRNLELFNSNNDDAFGVQNIPVSNAWKYNVHEISNNIGSSGDGYNLSAEVSSRKPASYTLNSGLSEDSDYTSDVSYPIQQYSTNNVSSHHSNVGASQFGGYSNLSKWVKGYDDVTIGFNQNEVTPKVDRQTLAPVDENTYDQHRSRLVGSRKLPQPIVKKIPVKDENEPLSCTSRPHRKLPNVDFTEKSKRVHLTQVNKHQDGFIYENYMQTDKNSTNSIPKTFSIEQSMNNFEIPQTSSPAKPRRYQPLIPRKRSLERQKGFEQYEDSSNTPSIPPRTSSVRPRTPLSQPDQVSTPLPKKLPQISQTFNVSSIFTKELETSRQPRSLPEVKPQQLASQQQQQQNQQPVSNRQPAQICDINQWQDDSLFNKDEFIAQDVQRQDSYESYGTSIATEPEMNEDWALNRSQDSSDSHVNFQKNHEVYPRFDDNLMFSRINESAEQSTMEQVNSHSILSSTKNSVSNAVTGRTSTDSIVSTVSKMGNFLAGSVNALSVAANTAVSSLNTQENDQYNYQNTTNLDSNSNHNAVEESTQPLKYPISYDHKDLWKSSASTDSMIWQTVSEDDVYEDTLQDYYNREKNENLLANTTQDVTTERDFIKSDSLDNEPFICQPASMQEEPFVRDINSQTSFNSEFSQNVTFQPQSALKTESRSSSEPKTVTFCDQIKEEKILSEIDPSIDGQGTKHFTPNNDIPIIVEAEKNNNELNGFAPPEGQNFLETERDQQLPDYNINTEMTEVLPKARIRWLSAFNKIVSQSAEILDISG